MRIGTFKASNFRQLASKMSGFPWELFLYRDETPEVKVSTSHSRLYHGAAITERSKEAIGKRLSQYGLGPPAALSKSCNQQVFIRVKEDRFTLSLNSSGEILHKRGIKKTRTAAPIRETIAAAVLALANYTTAEPLVDPMCGSGTFSIEGAMMAKHIPPGWYRDFAFMGWPGFKERQWAYLKREAGKEITGAARPSIFASDKDEKACRVLVQCIISHDLSDRIKVSVKDFFDLSREEPASETGLVVINPPYGRRMGSHRDSNLLFAAVCDRLKKEYRGWKLALIAPNRQLRKTVPFELTAHPLYHGGLNLTLLEGTIP